MATQVVEFNATTGLTITLKLFAPGSDTVVSSAVAAERTNDKNRYRATFTDVPAGTYRVNGFVGSVGGYVNDRVTLLLASGDYFLNSELAGQNAATAAAQSTNAATQTAAGAMRTSLGMANANLDTQLGAASTERAAIYAASNSAAANASTAASQTAAPAIRSALGMGSANLDSQLGSIVTVVGTTGVALSSAARQSISQTIANDIEEFVDSGWGAAIGVIADSVWGGSGYAQSRTVTDVRLNSILAELTKEAIRGKVFGAGWESSIPGDILVITVRD